MFPPIATVPVTVPPMTMFPMSFCNPVVGSTASTWMPGVSSPPAGAGSSPMLCVSGICGIGVITAVPPVTAPIRAVPVLPSSAGVTGWPCGEVARNGVVPPVNGIRLPVVRSTCATEMYDPAVADVT